MTEYRETEYTVSVYKINEEMELLGVHNMTKFPLWSDVLSLHPSAFFAQIDGRFKGHKIRRVLIYEHHDLKKMYGDCI